MMEEITCRRCGAFIDEFGDRDEELCEACLQEEYDEERATIEVLRRQL